MKEPCPSGSASAFLRRRRSRPDRIVGSPGGGGPSPGIGRVPHGRPDRPGANGAFCLSGLHVLPEPATLLSPAPPPWLPSPCFARARRCSPSSLPPLSSVLLALIRAPRVRLADRKRAFACGVPGALRGTWVSPTRF